MVYITGDKHADFYDVCYFCKKEKTNKEDLMIILGDTGINYFNNQQDYELKEKLSNCSITFFCIHGNREERPEDIETYIEKEFLGGQVLCEEKYPNILFAKDGEIYNINNKKVFDILKKNNNNVYVILSHTCPYKYMPREVFMSGINQTKVDYSTERFLDEVENNTNYTKWYCGHYHTEKQIDKMEFMFGRIKDFNIGEFVPKFEYNNYEIIRDAFSKKDTYLDSSSPHCPKCNSNDIVLQKGGWI